MEKVSRTTKVAKTHFLEDQIWISVEQFLPLPELVKEVLTRCIDVLDLARTNFVDTMQESTE